MYTVNVLYQNILAAGNFQVNGYDVCVCEADSSNMNEISIIDRYMIRSCCFSQLSVFL